MKAPTDYSHVIIIKRHVSVINFSRTNERMVAIKQRPENRISQPLIGEDYQCCGENRHKCLTSYGFVVYFKYSYFIINTSYHDIAVINISERALHYLFLLNNLFTRSHKLVCGCLHASWLITGLHS